MLIAGKRQSCLAHSCWLQIKKPVCMSAANAHGTWSGWRQGHLSACHLPAARTCAWYHGLDGDEDTCLHVTCWQQGNAHGTWSGRRQGHLSACHLPAARTCAWYHGLDGDEDTCLHVTCWQQGNAHGTWSGRR